MRRDRFGWLALLGLFALGCGGSSSNAAAESTEEEGDDGDGEDGDEKSAKKRKKMERPVSEEGKRWGGWRWKGKREDCFYVHRNQCFASLDEACRAAKCGKDDCVHDEAAPAKVSCDE